MTVQIDPEHPKHLLTGPITGGNYTRMAPFLCGEHRGPYTTTRTTVTCPKCLAAMQQHEREHTMNAHQANQLATRITTEIRAAGIADAHTTTHHSADGTHSWVTLRAPCGPSEFHSPEQWAAWRHTVIPDLLADQAAAQQPSPATPS